MSADETGQIAISVVGDLLLFLAAVLLRRFRALLDRSNPVFHRVLLAVLLALYVAIVFVSAPLAERWRVFTILAASGVLVWVVLAELGQFWRVGLVGVGRSLDTPIGFSKSLNMCKNSLDFLGIGASKLTDTGEPFVEAVLRCGHTTNDPVRFLLCDPEDARLAEMAKKQGVDPEAYKRKVAVSLKVIDDLRRNRAAKLEVRLYSDLPAFRLMFIDDEICLASHYVFGEGDGIKRPQLVVRNTKRPERNVDSLYHGFREYYEQLWNVAKPWKGG